MPPAMLTGAGLTFLHFLGKHHDRIIVLLLRDYRNGKQVPLGEGSFPSPKWPRR